MTTIELGHATHDDRVGGGRHGEVEQGKAGDELKFGVINEDGKMILTEIALAG